MLHVEKQGSLVKFITCVTQGRSNFTARHVLTYIMLLGTARRTVKLLLPYVTHVINFTRLPHFSTCNIEKLGGTWVWDYVEWDTVLLLFLVGYRWVYMYMYIVTSVQMCMCMYASVGLRFGTCNFSAVEGHVHFVYEFYCTHLPRWKLCHLWCSSASL